MLKSQLCTISYLTAQSWWNAHNLNARYLTFTEPVELVGMLKSNLNARYLNSH
jgi:hypothetical protein